MFRKNPTTLFCIVLVTSTWMTGASDVFAQGRLRRPERLGLIQVWSRAIPTGVGGKISGVHLHLSSSDSYTATDVVDRYGRRKYFSDLGFASISPGGYDQIERLAELKRLELEARGLGPSVESQSIPVATLYVRSNSGMVTALNAESGQVKWTVKAGKHGYPSYSVAASDDYVVALSSTKMFLLDARTGQVLDTVSTRSIPSSTPTLDGKYIYVPTWRGVIEVYTTEDFGPVEFTLGSTSPVVGSVTLCPESISWVTDAGDLYVGNRQRPGIKFRFETPDTISSAPAYLDHTLFAGSLDGFVYAIDDMRGGVKWRYSAGGPIDVSPLAVNDVVFATTRDGQLTCLDPQTGESKWTARGIKRFLSASTHRLYCATLDDRLAVIDTATGSRIASDAIGPATVPFVNIASDRLYLASDDGVLTCLREAEQRWPIVRPSNMIPLMKQSAVAAEASDGNAEPSSPPAGGDVTTADPGDAPDDFMADEVEGDAGAADAGDAVEDDGDPFLEFDESGFGDDVGAGDGAAGDAEEDVFNDL